MRAEATQKITHPFRILARNVVPDGSQAKSHEVARRIEDHPECRPPRSRKVDYLRSRLGDEAGMVVGLEVPTGVRQIEHNTRSSERCAHVAYKIHLFLVAAILVN